MVMTRRTHSIGFILLVTLASLALVRLASAQTRDPETLEQGMRLYSENCAACHGPQGQGRIGATLAKDWPSIRPDLTVKTIIERGVPGSVMPAWSLANGGPLTPAEIDSLVGYILSWQTGGAPQITPQPSATLVPPITPIPNVAGDPNHGAVLFAENCAMCHGAQGQGRTGATLAKDWPGIRPDLNIRNTIAGGISGSLMPAWGQANGGPLSEVDIDDLVAFLLALEGANPVVQVSPVAPPFIPPGPSPFGGWIGVALFVVLFAVIVVAALLLQRRSQR
jgi:mono/diheme cytochrome c family protein